MDKKELLIQAVRRNIYKFNTNHIMSNESIAIYSYKDLHISASRTYVGISFKAVNVAELSSLNGDISVLFKEVRDTVIKKRMLKHRLRDSQQMKKDIISLNELKREYL